MAIYFFTCNDREQVSGLGVMEIDEGNLLVHFHQISVVLASVLQGDFRYLILGIEVPVKGAAAKMGHFNSSQLGIANFSRLDKQRKVDFYIPLCNNLD